MRRLQFRACAALLLIVLGGASVLTACQLERAAQPTTISIVPTAQSTALPATAAPQVAPITPSPTTGAVQTAPAAPPQAPTRDALPPASASPTTLADLAPTNFAPTLSPLRQGRLAAKLPPNQPWLLVGDERSRCGHSVQDYYLFAVSPDGQLTQLDQTVAAMAERPGAPPLLVTCAADGAHALVDTAHWTRLPLALEANVVVNQIILAPDRTHDLLTVSCQYDAKCSEQASIPGRIVDLRTGAMRPFAHLPVSYGGGSNSISVSVGIVGWGTGGIYYTTTMSKAGGTTFGVLDPADPHEASRELARNAAANLNLTRELLATTYASDGNASLVLTDLRHGTTQTIEQTAWISDPTFTTDGTALAYFRADQDLYAAAAAGHIDLVLFDTVHNTKAVLGSTFSFPYQNQATVWSRDGQRLVAITQSGSNWQATLLMRDGTLVNTIPVPWGRVLGLTDDDQLMFSTDDGQRLTWLPLRAGDAPAAPDVILPEGTIYSSYIPRSAPGAAPVTPPGPATPAITQLPTPAVPTPLPATRAPIVKLANVPPDAELIAGLPLRHYVLYRVGSALYTQPLRGGPVVSLGGSDTETINPLSLTPDGNALLAQLPDGIYSIALSDGKRVRRSQPPANSGASGVTYALVSPDGSSIIYGVIGTPPALQPGQHLASDWIVALYSVPTAGGAPRPISPPLDPDTQIGIFMITPDSHRVVYTVATPDPNVVLQPDNRLVPRTIALYSAPITGGPAMRLAESASADDPIGGMTITPDSQYVLYQPRSATALFSVAVAGGSPAQLSGIGTDRVMSYSTSPDHQWVLYSTTAAIHKAPVAGGPAVELTGGVGAGEGVFGWSATPDGTQLVFRTRTALYRAPFSGGPATPLSGLRSSDVLMRDGLYVAGERAVFQSENEIDSVALAGGPPIQLTSPLNSGTNLQMDQLSPDARFVIFTVEQEQERTRAIYSAPIAGGSPALLLSGDQNETVLYETSGRYAIGLANGTLYAAPLAGGLTLQLSRARPTSSVPLISADGRQIVYIASRSARGPADSLAIYVAMLATGLP